MFFFSWIHEASMLVRTLNKWVHKIEPRIRHRPKVKNTISWKSHNKGHICAVAELENWQIRFFFFFTENKEKGCNYLMLSPGAFSRHSVLKYCFSYEIKQQFSGSYLIVNKRKHIPHSISSRIIYCKYPFNSFCWEPNYKLQFTFSNINNLFLL